MYRVVLNILLGLFIYSSIYSQTGSIRGFVYEKETGEPSMFTNVYLVGTPYGNATDINGYFNITKIPPGNYILKITAVGYDSITEPITIKASQIINKRYDLQKSSIQLSDAVVTAKMQEMKTEIRTSIVKLTPKQIKQMPSIGGEADIAQYLQVLPGVIFTGDQGGQLYIRGGPPIENKVLLDGMTIYNPFHSIGLFSVFETDIIRNADIYTGGFSAEYGGRISSIMDITTIDGNKKRLAGKLSTNTFGSNLVFEGPIIKYTDNSNSTLSFISAAKTSYLKQSSKYLYHYIDTAGMPFTFTDLYGKISLNANNGSKINLFGFRFSDRVNYNTISDLNWREWGCGSNIILVPSGSSALIKSNFAYSEYGITIQEADQLPRSSFINGFNAGLAFIYYIGKKEINYGLDVEGFKTTFDYHNTIGRRISQMQNTTNLTGYVKYKLPIKKFLIEPSFRTIYYVSSAWLSPEPRLGIKYNITDKFRIKLATGFYSQNLISANSDRDVVSLFYGFLSAPDELQTEFDGKKIKHNLQLSKHIVFGFEYDIMNNVNVNIEGYYKFNSQLTNINRNKIFDDIAEYASKPDYLKKDFIIERGSAYGVDFVIKYDHKRTYLWMVYSLGYVKRFDGVIEYYPIFDRRHNVNLVGSYTFGKKLNWELNARWNLGSGFPFTQTQGFYPLIPFTNGINSDYTSVNGEMGIIYGTLNQGRLPYYHRLDGTLKKRFEIGKNSSLDATFSITNIYNRKNIFYFDRVKYKRVNQLPIMPSIGLNMKF